MAIRKKESLGSQTQRTIRYLIGTLIVMIVVLSISLLNLTSKTAQNGYTLQQEKMKKEHLETINSNLTTKITESTAFAELQENEKVRLMRLVEDKVYITAEDNSVN